MKTNNYIRLSDKAYPISFSEMQREVKAIMSRDAGDDTLIGLGFANVYVGNRPDTGPVTEVEPKFNEVTGRWEQAFVVRRTTPAEEQVAFNQQKLTLIKSLHDLREDDLRKGFKHEFSNGLEQHIQLRDGDRANLAGLRLKAMDFKSKGVTDAVFSLRTFENVQIPMTPSEMIIATDAAFDGYMFIMSNCWALESEINDAQEVSEFPELPLTLSPI